MYKSVSFFISVYLGDIKLNLGESVSEIRARWALKTCIRFFFSNHLLDDYEDFVMNEVLCLFAYHQLVSADKVAKNVYAIKFRDPEDGSHRVIVIDHDVQVAMTYLEERHWTETFTCAM